MKFLKVCAFLLGSSFVFSVCARNVFLEFKGAYFLPTSSTFKKIYKGNALCGPELTVQLWNEKKWYLFTSFDYLKTNGYSIGLHDRTSVRLYPLALGIKYFFPALCETVDFYTGLGFEAMNVRTYNDSPDVTQKISKWGAGMLAKLGCYYYLPHNFLIDAFVDYSFVTAGYTKFYSSTTGLQRRRAGVSGAIFGAAIGYKF